MTDPATDWTANLASLDVGTLCDIDTDTLLSLDGDDQGDGYTEDVHGKVADVGTLERHTFTPRVRSYEDVRMIHDARDHLDGLPAEGETRHLLLGGNYNPWSLVPAVHHLAGQPIEELVAATLSYSQYNAADLLAMIDRGEIKRATLLVARMFSSKNPEMYRPLYDGLKQRGHRCGSYRTHAKVFAIKLTDGRCYTIEGSANWRSCKCVEQAAVTCDRGLYEWHRQWIEGVLTQVGEQ